MPDDLIIHKGKYMAISSIDITPDACCTLCSTVCLMEEISTKVQKVNKIHISYDRL